MKFKIFLITSIILINTSGCTTVQTHSYANAPVVNDMYKGGQKASVDNVQILYSEPRKNYESIGVFSIKKYKPGFTDPTVSDAIDELKEAGRNLGASAVIIRNVTTHNGTRFTTIEGEAIRWR
jgi:hypothetical protein